MKKIKIVADNQIPFLKSILEPYCDVEYYPGKDITKEKITDADALIIRTRTKCNSELLDGTNVKLITTATIGIDHIDTDYCNRNNVKWVNAPGCNSSSVMQYIASVLLTLAENKNFDLSSKTIGIIGVGNVGSKIQKVAETLGMNVLLNDPPRAEKEGPEKFSDRQTIQNECDIITFHVPLIHIGEYKTFHLADNKFFSNLKKKPILINSSRGEVIETNALKNAIKNNLIQNVVLDVWENEPDIDLELLKLVDIATPHIAGYSADGKANGTAVCVNEINKYFGFGLKQKWYPENVPLPEHGNEIIIDCKDKTLQAILHEAVLKTYNVNDDNRILKKSPATFEKQRGDYRIRREFNNYKIKLANCNQDVMEILKKLGFK